MISFNSYLAQWTGNIRGDILSGLVVALALIPEAIAFSIIAGVDPKVGLYASFSIAVITAIVGGRPGMISAATAATAVLMVTLVKEHGLEYLLAATVLAGLIQIARRHRPAWLCDALRLEIGDDRLRQCACDPDLHGAAARAHRRALAHLCHGRCRACDHLPVSADHHRHPLAAGHHRGADRHHLVLRLRPAHRWRHGRPARHAAGVPDPRHSAQPGNAVDHPALFGRSRRRRPA
jgi:hypothetical protein